MNTVAQRSVSDKAQTPINVARFYPDGPQSPEGSTFGWGGTGANADLEVSATREVQYTRTTGGSFDGAGVNAKLEVAMTREVHYTRPKGVSFDGKRSGETKLTWMWKVEDVRLEDGLEDPCEFWVTIPPVEKGVKANLKVTCAVRGTARDRRPSRKPTLVYTS
jgi:hypothetical protein